MACLYSLYKHKALIDSFQREKSGQFPTPQQTYHLAHRAAGAMCVTVHQWQICDAVFSLMSFSRGLSYLQTGVFAAELTREPQECDRWRDSS